MAKYIVMGGYDPEVFEEDDWESAFWSAYKYLGENIASITKIPEEEEHETD